MDPRADGPWDITEFVDDGVERLDLGALRIAPEAGVEVQVQVDEASGQVSQLSFRRGDAAVQVQPYAAPRSGGLWDEVRAQIRSSVNSSGGLVEEAQGPFGTELRAQVRPADGSTALQPARFTGIEGPRWFLRAVFLGSAARPGESADALEAMVRRVVVVRGTDAMPVGQPIMMTVPQSARPDEADASGGGGGGDGPSYPSPFERGPEITEIR